MKKKEIFRPRNTHPFLEEISNKLPKLFSVMPGLFIERNMFPFLVGGNQGIKGIQIKWNPELEA